MNPNTFESYKAASTLQKQACILVNKLELLADKGNRQAEKLIMRAWHRYQRRAYKTNEAAQHHWGWGSL
jgi:hypothetical protein